MSKKTKLLPIYVVLGTRAQLIKTAPIMKELDKRKIDYKFIFTAQHKETINQLRKDFELKEPDYILGVKNEASSINNFLGWFIKSLMVLISKSNKIIEKPGLVIVHGDTLSCLWGAILGKLRKCKVLHVESGLRSFNFLNPFPEEIIRNLVFMITDIYACPNKEAMKNLRKYKGVKINCQRNTQFDSVKLVIDKNMKKKWSNKYGVVSIHRFENIFKKTQIEKIVEILTDISKEMELIFVLHPSTKKQLEKFNLFEKLKTNENINLSKRLSFVEFINLVNNCEFVITDGGSNQEELSYLGVPTLLFRNYTERNEGMNENAVLSAFDDKKINNFINNYKKYDKRKQVSLRGISPSKLIVDYIEKKIGN